MQKLLLLLTFFATSTFAQEKQYNYRLLDVEYFDMRYQQFDHNRDPYAPEYDGKWAYRAAADFRLNFMESIYWDNTLHTEALRSGPVKTVGWRWELGLRLSNNIDLFHEHHSRHIMEEDRDSRNGSNVFPVEDSYGLRIKFIERPRGRSVGSWLWP